MTYHAIPLWLTAIVMWGLTVTAALCDVRLRLIACLLGVTCITSLTALAASCVTSLADQIADRLGVHVTGRVDRAYLTMACAFIRRQTAEDAPARSLATVPAEGTARL